ncbi:MAG: amidohydrolase family protein [Patescibacteria group bacterium]|nr:amidohydrolase family protein [Patescibacteria group bacterium]
MSRFIFTLFLVLGYSHVFASEQASRILFNGKVITVDRKDSVQQAIAIVGRHILAVGSNEEIEKLAGPDTEIIDLEGRAVTPGLLDAHAHFAQGGLAQLLNIDLSYPNVKNMTDVVSLVAERNATLGSGDWLIGRGWDEGKLEELRYIYASDIDPVSGNRPAWLVHTMGHYGVANGLALMLAGIDQNTPDPPGGVIDRDAEGKPTGVLKESAMGLVTKHIPAPGETHKRDAIRHMAAAFNSECMTGAKDPGIGWGMGGDLEDARNAWQAYQDVLNEGALSVRIFALWPSPQNMDDARSLIREILHFTKPYESTGDDHLISGGIKIFADGSGGARTAWLWDDWNRNRTGLDEGNSGYPAFDADIIRNLIFLYHDNGLNMGVHAIGDRTIDWVVASYALALNHNPHKGLRHSIIHANIPTELAMNTMVALQREFDAVYPEPSPGFTWWIGDTYAGNFGVKRSLRLNPFHSFQQKGIKWASGSDFNVTPFAARYGLWASIAREPLLGVYGKEVFGTAESVDIHVALRSYTIWAARQMFLEKETGSIEPGKYADLAVWDTDFYTAPTANIKDAQCEMTLFNGEVVYQSVGGSLAADHHTYRGQGPLPHAMSFT